MLLIVLNLLKVNENYKNLKNQKFMSYLGVSLYLKNDDFFIKVSQNKREF